MLKITAKKNRTTRTASASYVVSEGGSVVRRVAQEAGLLREVERSPVSGFVRMGSQPS